MALGVLELSLEGLDDGWAPEKLGEKRPSGHLNAGLVADFKVGWGKQGPNASRWDGWTPPTLPFLPAF